MKLVYTAQARANLDEIADYLNNRNPRAAIRVADKLRQSVDRLTRYPLSGRSQTIPGVRKAVEPKYGYLIYYAVVSDELVVLSIRHPAQARTYEDL